MRLNWIIVLDGRTFGLCSPEAPPTGTPHNFAREK